MKNFKRQKNLWNEFRKYGKNVLKIPERILDIASVIFELELTARGLSVYTIAEYLDLDVDDVIGEIYTYTGFKGFDTDLDTNPIGCYNNGEMNKLENIFNKKEIDEIIMFIEKYNELKKELDIYYGD